MKNSFICIILCLASFFYAQNVLAEGNLHSRYAPLLLQAARFAVDDEFRKVRIRCDLQVMPWIENALDNIFNKAPFNAPAEAAEAYARSRDEVRSEIVAIPSQPLPVIEMFIQEGQRCGIPDYIRRLEETLDPQSKKFTPENYAKNAELVAFLKEMKGMLAALKAFSQENDVLVKTARDHTPVSSPGGAAAAGAGGISAVPAAHSLSAGDAEFVRFSDILRSKFGNNGWEARVSGGKLVKIMSEKLASEAASVSLALRLRAAGLNIPELDVGYREADRSYRVWIPMTDENRAKINQFHGSDGAASAAAVTGGGTAVADSRTKTPFSLPVLKPYWERVFKLGNSDFDALNSLKDADPGALDFLNIRQDAHDANMLNLGSPGMSNSQATELSKHYPSAEVRNDHSVFYVRVPKSIFQKKVREAHPY